MVNYFSSYLVMSCIYAIMALALNLQWGFTGLMNFGIGAFLVWAIWIGSDFITDFVPAGIATQIGFIRMFFVGTILGVMILIRPQGILTQKLLTIELFREEEAS